MEDKYKALITCFGIGSIAFLEACAIFNGINGTGLSTVVGAVAAIVGAVVGVKIGSKKP